MLRPSLRRFTRIDIGFDPQMDDHVSYIVRRTHEWTDIGGATLLIPRSANRRDMLLILDRLRTIIEDAWRGVKYAPEGLTAIAYAVRKKVVAERREAIAVCKREGRSPNDDPNCWTGRRHMIARANLREVQSMFFIKAKRKEVEGVAALVCRPRVAADVVALAEKDIRAFVVGLKKERAAAAAANAPAEVVQ
jgi:hypothetical protein